MLASVEYHITPTVSLPQHYAMEWMQGLRPMPGADAWQYYEEGIRVGMYTEEQASALLKRHRYLEQLEAGQAEPEIPAEVRDWLISQGWTAPMART